MKLEVADGIREVRLGAYKISGNEVRTHPDAGTAGYGTVCPVVWEDGGGNSSSYPIWIVAPKIESCYTIKMFEASHKRREHAAI